jgi:hypothetical protein
MTVSPRSKKKNNNNLVVLRKQSAISCVMHLELPFKIGFKLNVISTSDVSVMQYDIA